MKSGGSSSALADQEAERQATIEEGTEQINDLFDSQFDDDYYDNQIQSYLDYANPQLQDQYDDAKEQLIYALDRSGTTNSSAYASKLAELQKAYATNQRTLNNTAQDYSNDAQDSVEAARSDLISQLNSTADLTGTIDSANSRAAALNATPAYSALGQMFSTFLSTLNGYNSSSSSSSSDYTSSGTTLYSTPSSTVVNS